MLAYAVLSGLHATLPEAELRGILEALGHRYQVVERLDLLAILRCSCHSTQGVASRSGMVQETGKVLAVAEAEPRSIEEALLEPDWCLHLEPGDRVKITLRRLRGYAKQTIPDSYPRSLARQVASLIKPCRAETTPKNPTKNLRIIVTQGVAVIGLEEDRVDNKTLHRHRPQLRPFFHPGSLDPHLARLFINLSRAQPHGTYLDPFCGTGGFPLEAQELGIPTICGELHPRLAHGARVNLQYYPGHLHTITVAQWDATRLPLRDNTVTSIGTDPPYGRSISLRGKPLNQLLQGFLAEAARVLKPGGHLAYATPHWAEEQATTHTREVGLEILEKHYQRVHGTLTRVIIVAQKP